MPLTASKTDAWTIAPTRVATSGEVFATCAACNRIWFQSVTSSAAVFPARPTASTARATSNLYRFLMLFLPFVPTGAGHWFEFVWDLGNGPTCFTRGGGAGS